MSLPCLAKINYLIIPRRFQTLLLPKNENQPRYLLWRSKSLQAVVSIRRAGRSYYEAPSPIDAFDTGKGYLCFSFRFRPIALHLASCPPWHPQGQERRAEGLALGWDSEHSTVWYNRAIEVGVLWVTLAFQN